MVNIDELDKNKIYIAFHKGDTNKFGNKLISSIIKFSTRDDFNEGKAVGINKNQYSHTEMIFPEWIAGKNNCFSSRGTAKPNGVAFLPDLLRKNPSRWDIQPLDWIHTEKDISEAYNTAKSLVGKPYAYNNVLNTFAFVKTYKDRKGKDDWWCSEADAYAAGIADYKVSPNRLYTLVYVMNHAYNRRGWNA